MDDSKGQEIRWLITRKDLKITLIITIGILHVFNVKFTKIIRYPSVSAVKTKKRHSKLLSALILYKHTGVKKEYDIEFMPDPIYFCYKSQCFQLLSMVCILNSTHCTNMF